MTERLEAGLLALILTVVAVAAGGASFTHMHDWTMRHAAPGASDAFGWVNAVVADLVPMAAYLVIRRRKRKGQGIGYAIFLMLAAGAFSLAAQLAVAPSGLSAWVLSAVPALAFIALVHLVLGEFSSADKEKSDPVPVVERPDEVVAVPIADRPSGVVPMPAGAFSRQEVTRP
ncbi:hypothetical protein GCM10010435_37590 [Winogradskya consettensis]|uniref:DUF2637 domain-containing protein n=1 Tax=Winogradskya consettensis TaxID=113560 RepID=A0A919T2Z0_9ACTN|nr:hypothetical protein [Actinoplanes consettensis]GIM83840.1 hypothetical protein Aco04nite_88500 [Actinoplanes consettensis]